MPVATIPGRYGRSSTVEVFEPAQTQDDAEVLIERFELGANEVRENYVTPSPYTSFRYRDEAMDEIVDPVASEKQEPVKLLPHMQEEGEAGQARLAQLAPAGEAVDQYQRDQGVELPAERAARWNENVEELKGQQLPIEESSRKVLEGRVNRTQQDMVPVGEDDYESSGSGSGASRTKQAGKAKSGRPAGSTSQSGQSQAERDAKAAEARQKAQDARSTKSGT